MEYTGVVTVLSARRYSFPDEENPGRQVEGCKIEYVEDWEGAQRQNAKGVDVYTATIDYEDFEALQQLPADFDARFKSRKNGKGQQVLHVVSLQFVQYFTPVCSALVSPNAEKPGADKPGK